MTYDPSAQYEVREWDEVYLEIDGKKLLARIYQPVGTGPYPAIVNIHGGTWTHLDRRADFYPCRQLAASGLVVISFDFRLAPESKYPACLQDTNFAVRWTKLNANRLKIRPELVGGFGRSTGAQMITLTALRPVDALFSAIPLPGGEELDASLSFVLAAYPVFDVTARYEHAARQPEIASWVDNSDYPRLQKPMPATTAKLVMSAGKALRLWGAFRGLPLPGYAKFEHWFEERIQSFSIHNSTRPGPRKKLMAGLMASHENYFSRYEEMAEASPLSVLFAGGAQRYPPIYVVQSPGDEASMMESSLTFVSAYLRVGGRIEFNQRNGLAHGFAHMPSHQADACILEMKQFLQGVFLRDAEHH